MLYYIVSDELCCCTSLFQAELYDLRNNICTLLENPADVVPLVNKLNFAQCTYLLSVFRLETLRLVHHL